MKTRDWILLFILWALLAWPSFAQQGLRSGSFVAGVMGGVGAAGGACSYTQRDSEETDDSYNNITGTVGGATKWVAGYSGTWTLKRMSVALYRGAGETTDTVTIQIWSGATPTTKIGESSSINKSTINVGSAAWHDFDFASGVSITAGTTYWIAVIQSGTTTSIYWRKSEDVSYGANIFYTTDNGSDWSVLADNWRNLFKAYTCD